MDHSILASQPTNPHPHMQIPPPSYNCYFNPIDKKIHVIRTSTVSWIIQVGCFYDICFRLADSVSVSALQAMTIQAERILTTPQDERLFLANEQFLSNLEVWKERGRGECVLDIPKIRAIMSETILEHDEIECQVGAFVIMGNHIHLILRMLGLYSPYDLITNIKIASARKINSILGRQGQLWMQGEYNHLIRSPASLRRKLKYLQDNPKGMPIPVYVRADDRLFTPYVTPPEEMATQEQRDKYMAGFFW